MIYYIYIYIIFIYFLKPGLVSCFHGTPVESLRGGGERRMSAADMTKVMETL